MELLEVLVQRLRRIGARERADEPDPEARRRVDQPPQVRVRGLAGRTVRIEVVGVVGERGDLQRQVRQVELPPGRPVDLERVETRPGGPVRNVVQRALAERRRQQAELQASSSQGDVDPARAERLPLSRLRVERVPPDAARVVRQQVDRDRGLVGGRPHAVDVVVRRDERVEVPGPSSRRSTRSSAPPVSAYTSSSCVPR